MKNKKFNTKKMVFANIVLIYIFTMFGCGGNSNNSSFIESNNSTYNQSNIISESLHSSISYSEFDVNGSINLLSSLGLNESAHIEFESTLNNVDYHIYLEGGIYSEFTLTDNDNMYIQKIDNSYTIDLFGLKGDDYKIKIIPYYNNSYLYSKSLDLSLNIKSYDRSGYAHFKYDEGVGAYNNDGTLKENAVVIYVNDENKDYVMGEIEEIQDAMFDIPSVNKKALGIGWWLNNAQYSKSGSNTYDSKSVASKLGFNKVCQDSPIVIRIVGEVNSPEGLTAYDSTNFGGTIGDNGNMARMKNLRNITIEGVGFDACIKGWGLHFINSDASLNYGKNFEVRNLTFDDYCEDAIGMEGVQEDSTLTAPVQRCWIHHNTFLSGYCQNPAESDKENGDGSCDFKRGLYFTLSYCYFENCDKTGLIGSSDSSLQYNVTYHHNIFFNCASRIPLLRRANVHFYNNYLYADNTVSLSYVTSLRADCYIYSEYNYYERVKKIFDKDGGSAKCYNNTYLAVISSSSALTNTVSNRNDSVAASASCSYKNISYKDFDTNNELFYYDSINQKSDCYLTDSFTAKKECLIYSGSYFRTVLNQTALKTDFNSNKYDLDTYVNLSSGSYTSTIGKSIDGIYYQNEGKVKGKGQIVTFNLNESATFNIALTCSSSEALYDGYLVSKEGKVISYIEESISIKLEPGLYYIVSGTYEKESKITSLSFTK